MGIRAVSTINATAVAVATNASLGTVSLHIRELEDEIGLNLFERVGRKSISLREASY
jgi:DNA-binding transcriptional LysR family regulator